MNYNVFLLRLGLDPSQFTNRMNEPIKIDQGWLYEVDQKSDGYKCPHCHSDKLYIHDYNTIEINCRESSFIEDILRVRKVRFRCKACRKTFTPELRGIDPGFKTSNQTLQLIYSEFTGDLTFAAIGKRYGLSTARVIQIFDDDIKFVPVGRCLRCSVLTKFAFQKTKTSNMSVFSMISIIAKLLMWFVIVACRIFVTILVKLTP